jgi:hypothetical protein
MLASSDDVPVFLLGIVLALRPSRLKATEKIARAQYAVNEKKSLICDHTLTPAALFYEPVATPASGAKRRQAAGEMPPAG